MQNITQLQLIPNVTGNTQVGYIDITEDTIIPITFSISDVRDLTQRNGTFSKSIKVKGTKNNNKLFQYYFDVNMNDKNVSFNINKLAFCNVIQNGVVIMDNALLQLVSIVKKQETNLYDDEIEYQLLLKDTTSDFFNIINNKYLEELKLGFSADTLTPQLVVSSFSNTITQGYKYLMGYAGGETGDNSSSQNDALITLDEFKPAVFAKRYFDLIFFNAGYKYDWKTIDDPTIRFSKLIIPYNGNDVKGNNYNSSNLTNLISNAGATGHRIENDTKTGKIPESKGSFKYLQSAIPQKLSNFNIGFDPDGLFNVTTNNFVVPSTVDSSKSNTSIVLTYDLEIGMQNDELTSIILEHSYDISDNNTSGSMGVRPYVRMVKANGEAVSEPFMLSANNGISVGNRQTYTPGNSIIEATANRNIVIYSKNLKAGEQFYLELNLVSATNGNVDWDFNDRIFDTHPVQSEIKYLIRTTSAGKGQPASYNTNAKFYAKLTNLSVNYNSNVDNTYGNGGTVRYDNFIPLKVKQSDFVKSIATMFNLFFEVDKINNKLIHIYKRDEYYDAGITVDWTSKLDKGTEQELRFLPELQNKQFLLTYKQDSDFANELYFNATNEVYSQFLYHFDNQYVRDIKKTEITFSPTPIYYHPQLDATLPFINGLEPKNNIRILYDGGARTCNQYAIQAVGNSQNDKPKQLSATTYPLATHWNDPVNPDFSIEFGTNDYYFLTNNYGEAPINNLYNMHWRRTLNTMNTGRMFIGYFNLNEIDILNLKLNQKVIVHNSVWVINKIIDYDANSKKTTKVELINIDDKEPQPVFKRVVKKTEFINWRDLFNQWNLLRSGGLFGGVFSPIRSAGINNWGLTNSNAIGQIIGSNNTLTGSGWILGDDNAILTRIGGFNNIIGNGNNTQSDKGFIFGNGNRIDVDNNFSNLWGNNNFVASSNTDTNIWGHDNILSSNTRNSFIWGSENLIGRDVNNAFIFGTGNTINSGLSRVFLFGDDLTGRTSNTSYFRNIFIESGGTINGVPIDAVKGGYNDTGVIAFTGVTLVSPTQIKIPRIDAWFVDNETNPLQPVKELITYTGTSAITVTTLSGGSATYILLKKDKTIQFQNTFPTSADRKVMCYIAKVGHPAGTINVLLNEPDFDTSPLAQFRDVFQAFNYINKGVFHTAVSGLTIGRTAGTIVGNGINFHINPLIPNYLSLTAQTASQIIYRTQTGGTTGVVSVLDPANYDLNGVVTPVGGGSNSSTIQYVFVVPGANQFLIQYGQTVYINLAEAIANVGKENFVLFSNLVNNAILVGVIVINKNATNVLDTSQAVFLKSDLFGQLIGSAGGSPTTSLQGAYDNSANPEIITNSSLGAVTFRRGSASDLDNVLEVQNSTGATTFNISGRGGFTALTNSMINYQHIGGMGALGGTVFFGTDALQKYVGSPDGNTAIGFFAQVENLSGVRNTAVGSEALRYNTTGTLNTAIGVQALYQNGHLGNPSIGNVGLGYFAGRANISGGIITSSSNSIFIGRESRAFANGQSNEIVIGYEASGKGTNTVVIGNSTITDNYFTGRLNINATANTGTVNILTPAIVGRETVLQAMVSDNAVDKILIANGTTVAGRFAGGFVGYTEGGYGALFFRGLGSATDDVSTNTPYVTFLGANTSSSSDPNNGSLTQPTNRPLFSWGSVNTFMQMSALGNLSLGGTFNDGVNRLQITGDTKISGTVTANVFKTFTGTSSDSLMADGSTLTLERGSFSGGITITPAGLGTPTVNNATYSRIGDVVTVSYGFGISTTANTAQSYTLTLPLPIARASSTQRFIGVCNFQGGLTNTASVMNSTSTTSADVILTKTINGAETFFVNATYQYNILI